jgi:SAM-dependent methyltransferase
MVRNRSPFAQICESVAQLYVERQPVNWTGFDLGYSRSRMALPTYPFERKTYWHGTRADDAGRDVWQKASQAAISQAQFAPIGTHLEAFPEKWESLKKLTVALMLVTLRDLGALPPAGDYDVHDLLVRSGIAPQYHRLMRRWFALLESEGCISQSHGRIVIPSEMNAPGLAIAQQEAEAHLQDDPYLNTWLKNCATLMQSVLLGQVNPLETLFPGGSDELAANLYGNSPGPRYANAIGAAAVQAACAALPGDRKVRILEIGGGTGSFLASVLPKLPSRGVSYLFTDVSEQFLHRAAVRFADDSNLLYGILDVENESHLRTHRSSCDILLAANVVHATRDIQTTLERVRELVVPGGIVILLETTQSLAWHEITIALIQGWQKSDDATRGGETLMRASEWNSLLRSVGFVEVTQAPLSGSPAEAAGFHVLIAKAPLSRADAPVPSAQASELRWYAAEASQTPNKKEGSDIADRLAEVPRPERREIILDAVLEEVARVLRLGAGDSVRKNDRLMEIGLDSLMALDLSGRLSIRMGLDEMPATLMFDYPTPSAIADYLLGRLGEDAPGTDAAAPKKIASVNTQRLSEEEVFEMSDEAVAELLRSRLNR